MKHIYFKLIVIMFFLTGIISISYADDQTEQQKIDLTVDDSTINAFSENNPFQSQLPKIEKVEIIEQAPIFQNPTPVSIPTPVIEPEKPEPPTLILNGLVWDTDRPQAIINGKVVNQGDSIEGAKIVSIRKTGINLIFEDTKITLKP